MKMKEESEKVGLKLNIQKMKIMAPGPITSWQIDGETREVWFRLMEVGARGFGEKTEKEEYFRFNHLTYKNRRSKIQWT